jgi:hypothetical protein
MVSYSSDPLPPSRQDFVFILLLLLQNPFRSHGSTMTSDGLACWTRICCVCANTYVLHYPVYSVLLAAFGMFTTFFSLHISILLLSPFVSPHNKSAHANCHVSHFSRFILHERPEALLSIRFTSTTIECGHYHLLTG